MTFRIYELIKFRVLVKVSGFFIKYFIKCLYDINILFIFACIKNKYMNKQIKFLYAYPMRDLVSRLNDLGLTKEDIISVQKENGQYVVVYQ